MKITKKQGEACLHDLERGISSHLDLSEGSCEALMKLGWGAPFAPSSSRWFGSSRYSGHMKVALCFAATLAGVV